VQHWDNRGCNNLQQHGPAARALKAPHRTARGRASRASAAPGTKAATTSSAVSATQPDRLTARLRRETTLSLKWIAEQLAMGSWTHVSNLLGAERKRESLKSEN